MDIITCVGKVQETEFVRSRSEPGRNCKNNKKFAKNPLYMEGFCMLYYRSCESCASIACAKIYTFGDSRGWCPAVWGWVPRKKNRAEEINQKRRTNM